LLPWSLPAELDRLDIFCYIYFSVLIRHDMNIRIPVPASGGLLLSYKCTAACRHCMYACSPAWQADWITEADLEQILGQLAGKIQPSPYGPANISLSHGLHFTGGEPFLNFDLLCKALEISSGLNIPSLFVETNGYWCTGDQSTREKLLILRSKGLSGIMISVNPFYLEYVPFERTERAIRVSMEIFGYNAIVYQLEYYRRFKVLGIKGRIPFEQYLKLENRVDFARNTEFFIMGRAPYRLTDQLGEIYPRYPAGSLVRLPCSPPFLRNWHNHFDNYGNFIPGFCGGISLGDSRELDILLKQGIDPLEYPVLNYLVREDMMGLLQFAVERGYQVNLDGYYSRCHLCVDIRKHLHAAGKFRELKPDAFYSNLSEA
jgi:hypothetical protein